ncbi:hypothetical protein H6P81_017385 [Aristolochia fimbriata]|uniref:Sulfotransferase n=1 Tax=Aristolochia fimbriata TaxID=158543 RepID=A0AAV7DZD9_ARIFI|nr:hypothetical protein H6P81_017385 [Aristolochia fimbriata]
MAESFQQFLLQVESKILMSDEERDFLSTLPKHEDGCFDILYNFQGFWIHAAWVKDIQRLSQHFQPLHGDVLLATPLKTGTTWLKALAFCVMNRNSHEPSNTYMEALAVNNPHELVPTMGMHDIIASPESSTPRLLHTHFPYELLPEYVKTSTSACRIVYLCRNVGDNFISSWKFFNKLRRKDLAPLPLEEAFELFCNGVTLCGPYWEHVLGYWKASRDDVDHDDDKKKNKKVLFLRYEDLQRDPQLHLKRMASFLGRPFTIEEEEQGMVSKIVEACSFQRLSSLEVNKGGVYNRFGFRNSYFYERGVVGGCAEYLTPEMMDRLRRITVEKFQGSGLNLDI